MPEFPGGQHAFSQYLIKKLSIPSKVGTDANLTGSITVEFVVSNEGNICNVNVIKGESKEIDLLVVRVIESMPTWSPGLKNGLPVHVKIVLPLHIHYE